MKKTSKLLFIILLLVLAFYKKTFLSKPYFQIVFLNVDQGDAVLIITPQKKVILIDGGPDIKVLKELGKYLPFWKMNLDLVVLTHAHDDHFIGLIEISRRYKIKKIVYNNLNFNNFPLEALKKALKNNMVKGEEAVVNNYLYLEKNCSLKVLSAPKDDLNDENDYSIVSLWSCLGKRVLLMGDASLIIEQSLIKEGVELKADILKISHHGSNTANSENFIKEVDPKIAVISVGKNNKFKHPNQIILNRLKELAVDIYRTDVVGSVNFLANNKDLLLIK